LSHDYASCVVRIIFGNSFDLCLSGGQVPGPTGTGTSKASTPTWSHISYLTFHISNIIKMSSPLADFMSCLKQVNSLSTHASLVSDNARIASHIIAHNVYQKPARPSRWTSENENTQSPPTAPYRRGSIEHPAPMLPSRESSTECKPILPPAKAAWGSIEHPAPKLPSRQSSTEYKPTLPPAKAA
jgi:hypothetical protein